MSVKPFALFKRILNNVRNELHRRLSFWMKEKRHVVWKKSDKYSVDKYEQFQKCIKL
jgi:hypothetical protein